MNDPNRELFERVVLLLRPLLGELVFVGGCATGLLVTDAAAGRIRPTKDVDAIVEVTSYAKYIKLSERLRAVGLMEDAREGAPICRWRHQDLIIDVMPTDERILGFSNPTPDRDATTHTCGNDAVRFSRHCIGEHAIASARTDPGHHSSVYYVVNITAAGIFVSPSMWA